jgi:ketosteroid isomerase-like protein
MTEPHGRAALTIIVVLTMVVGCAQDGPSRQLSATDLAAIRSASLAYPEAWLSNEPEQVKATLTEDAVLMPSGGLAPLEGLPAISEFFWPVGAPPMEVTEFVMEPAEVAGTASLAYVRGDLTLEFEMESEGALETYRTSGTYLMILRPGSNRSWRISRYTWNHPPWERVASRPASRGR